VNDQPTLPGVTRAARTGGIRCTPACRRPGPSHAHCAAALCHRTFASVTDFDRHRRKGHCLSPASLGLVEAAGLWASPERHANDAALAERLADARFQRLYRSADGRTGRKGSQPGVGRKFADLSYERSAGPGELEVPNAA
jgi:hypothetical protein